MILWKTICLRCSRLMKATTSLEKFIEKYVVIFNMNVQLLLQRNNTCKMRESANMINHYNKMLVLANLTMAVNVLFENM